MASSHLTHSHLRSVDPDTGASGDARPAQIIEEGPLRQQLRPCLQDGRWVHAELSHGVRASGVGRHMGFGEAVDVIVTARDQVLQKDHHHPWGKSVEINPL